MSSVFCFSCLYDALQQLKEYCFLQGNLISGLTGVGSFMWSVEGLILKLTYEMGIPIVVAVMLAAEAWK